MILAGDIGGTKTLLGLFDPRTARPHRLHVREFPTASFSSMTEVVQYFASDPQVATAPISAARNALQRAHWNSGDVDLWEVNEAFAVVALAFMRDLKLTPDKVNIRGGAISLGHPIGCSGARILVTLLAALRERGARRGLAAICIGGGEGLAAAVELI